VLRAACAVGARGPAGRSMSMSGGRTTLYAPPPAANADVPAAARRSSTVDSRSTRLLVSLRSYLRRHSMSDRPKRPTDVDDLVKPEPTKSWRRVLSSALATIAASVAIGSGATPARAAIPPLTVQSSGRGEGVSMPPKLVFQPIAPPVQAADHYSHESHFSHESHASHSSHYSHYSG